uniref:C2 domain-containing protein n=1 Tax=Oryza punctata TaxID=4537 RepID=A0A0E0KRT0_ORYPU
MAYPYVFRAQAPPVMANDAMATRPQVREAWPAGGGGGGGGWMGVGSGERLASAYDLVEQMHYLYVRVVKARGLPAAAAAASAVTGGGGCNPYVEVRLGNYRGTTRHYERKAAPEWNQVFAFSRERVQATVLEVFVRDKDAVAPAPAARDGYIGKVAFDVGEAPVRVPPDSPLAPQWYCFEDVRDGGRTVQGEVMLAVWVGTQADEAFADAWHADAASVRCGDGVAAVQSTRSKVYVTPKLWYLRISVLEAQDVVPGAGASAAGDKGRHGEAFVVKVQVGGVMLRTKPCCRARGLTSLAWNEELVFVVAEPFDEPAVLIVEARAQPGKDEIVGRAVLPLTLFEKRLDRRGAPTQSQWFSLEPFVHRLRSPESTFAGRVHLRACLEGAYHVMDEATMYASDTRPTARQLWRPPIGVLEVGVLGAQGLPPMKTIDGRGTTDAYCVAKYGQKWLRTRTVVDSSTPRWNEQYTWEVYDPCTVLTLAVFDNCHLGSNAAAAGGKDQRIGKVRIRLSTLEMDRVYTNAHQLVVLHPSGVRKNGDICLAVRLTCLSLASVVRLYGQPLLPRMHYVHPFTIAQLDGLRRQAMGIVAARLSRAEPPLRREVVEYLLDADSHLWSIRRSKANFFRVTALLSGAASTARWLVDVCHWRSPATTILVHLLFVAFTCFPELILPTMFLYMSMVGVWNYRRRPRRPPQADARLSCAEATNADELDEELDTFPTSRPNDVVRVRYDRLRTVAGRIQTVVGDVATQGERVRSLLAWRDPRATAMFTALCLVAAVLAYVTPFRVVALVAGLYLLRHPRFRSRMPSAAGNFFKRLPSRADTML